MVEINKEILKKFEEAKEKQIEEVYGLIDGKEIMEILHSITSDLYAICDNEKSILEKIGYNVEAEEEKEKIQEELNNIKNIFKGMEDAVKKDITEEILKLEKEISDLKFEYEKSFLEKVIEKTKEYGFNTQFEYIEVGIKYELLPLGKKIQDKQYEKYALECKFAHDIKQLIE